MKTKLKFFQTNIKTIVILSKNNLTLARFNNFSFSWQRFKINPIKNVHKIKLLFNCSNYHRPSERAARLLERQHPRLEHRRRKQLRIGFERFERIYDSNFY